MSNREIPDKSAVKFKALRNRFRLLVRFFCLIGAVLCLLPVIEKDVLLAIVPALSPFVAVTSILSLKTIRPILALGLMIALVTTFRHRWFCRWICPMGLCLDGAGYMGKHLRRKPCKSVSIGRWLLILTLGGAVLGLPLFLWLDPLALFSGLFLVTEQHQQLVCSISFLFVILLFFLSLLKPYIWCRGLCPLGAFQDLLSIMSRSIRSALRPATGLPDCGSSGHPVARRTILGLIIGAASAGILRLTGNKSLQPLRPPGAVDKLTFNGLCTRCGNCLRACPYDIIRRDTGQYRLTGILTPVLTFNEDYCREDCNRCTLVCPSGALEAVSLKNKPNVRIGIAKVDMNLCLLSEDRECSACARWCPYNAIRYVFSEARYMLVPVIDTDKCNGCGACEVACPIKPDKAIRIFSTLINS
ncbi:MAG: 4Fe-4S dicluster domain-containing protein [Sedimentisphaerales bacterium]|nr:4Fe-4S dicluster domain-containing protein [Sedimentisphaerales bacterium]